MDFSPTARETQRPTVEHLQPKSLGGSDALNNLALCHRGCNKQLADRPRAEKERLRSRRRLRAARNAAGAPNRPVDAAPGLTITPPSQAKQPDWHRIATIAIAAAAFFAGVCVGMLIA